MDCRSFAGVHCLDALEDEGYDPTMVSSNWTAIFTLVLVICTSISVRCDDAKTLNVLGVEKSGEMSISETDAESFAELDGAVSSEVLDFSRLAIFQVSPDVELRFYREFDAVFLVRGPPQV